jgi:hypothetical protein
VLGPDAVGVGLAGDLVEGVLGAIRVRSDKAEGVLSRRVGEVVRGLHVPWAEVAVGRRRSQVREAMS